MLSIASLKNVRKFLDLEFSVCGGGKGGVAYDMEVFGICQFWGRYFGNLNKKWSVFGFSVA